jgi:hypothetical protein
VSRVLIYLGRFFIIVVGYAVAALAASAFLNIVTLGALGWNADEAPIVTGSLVFSIPFVALFIAYFAFIPSAAAILVAEIFSKRDWLYYAVAGGIVAVAVLGFFWHTSNEMYQVSGALDLPAQTEDTRSAISDPRLALLAVGAGMFGGMAYWLVAGRLAGSWRDTDGGRAPGVTGPGS